MLVNPGITKGQQSMQCHSHCYVSGMKYLARVEGGKNRFIPRDYDLVNVNAIIFIAHQPAL